MTSKTIYGCAPIQSSIDGKFHYVYRITNLVENKHYYGVKTSKEAPHLVMGYSYFGSPASKTNSWIIQDQKVNPSHYKYKILRCFEIRKEATGFEIFIHRKFDVKSHKQFYNEANQTSTGFDITGKTHSDEAREKMRKPKDGNLGENNFQFLGFFITPSGKFATRPNLVGVNPKTCAKWCKNSDRIINSQSYYGSKYLCTNFDNSIIGKPYREIGFDFKWT